jgi:hypothetical protein
MPLPTLVLHFLLARTSAEYVALIPPGYVGFHPPRPGQDEDSLSESNVKNGFILGQPVAVGTHEAVTEDIQS